MKLFNNNYSAVVFASLVMSTLSKPVSHILRREESLIVSNKFPAPAKPSLGPDGYVIRNQNAQCFIERSPEMGGANLWQLFNFAFNQPAMDRGFHWYVFERPGAYQIGCIRDWDPLGVHNAVIRILNVSPEGSPVPIISKDKILVMIDSLSTLFVPDEIERRKLQDGRVRKDGEEAGEAGSIVGRLGGKGIPDLEIKGESLCTKITPETPRTAERIWGTVRPKGAAWIFEIVPLKKGYQCIEQQDGYDNRYQPPDCQVKGLKESALGDRPTDAYILEVEDHPCFGRPTLGRPGR
ncbi:hypothetical protein ABW19_dt0204193 [Dactylella cylindrospora]|nr:hypothetical protein ABW19_dt0204193 [Dactylella cylindrospora]